MDLSPVLEAASAADWSRLADRALCDACLGRLFGKAGHGFTNPERGRAIRTRHPVPEGPCWLCRGLLSEVPKFAQLAAAKLAPWEYRTFLVGSRVDSEVIAREERLWDELAPTEGEPIKAEVNREVGKALARETGGTGGGVYPLQRVRRRGEGAGLGGRIRCPRRSDEDPVPLRDGRLDGREDRAPRGAVDP